MEDSVFSVTFDETAPGVSGPGRRWLPSGGAPGAHAPSKTSPFRGRTMKEYEELLAQLRKENFNLKLRIYFLEERSPAREGCGTGGADAERDERDQLLLQAARAVQLMEEQHRAQLAALHAQLRQRDQEQVRVQGQAEPQADKLKAELQLQQERAEGLQAQLAKQQARAEQLQAQQEILMENQQQVQELSDKLSEELSQQRQQDEELTEELARQRRRTEELTQQLTGQRQQAEELMQQLTEQRQRTEELTQQLTEQQREQEQGRQLQEKLNEQLQQQLWAEHERAEQLQAQLQAQPAPPSPGAGERLQQAVARTQEQLQQLERELVAVRAQLRQQTQARSGLEVRYERSVLVIQELARLGRAQEREAERARLRVETLEAELAHERERFAATEAAAKAADATDAVAAAAATPQTAPVVSTTPVIDERMEVREQDKDKDAEIARLKAELRKRNSNLQELVNKELWDRNREIARLQQGRLREPAERERDSAGVGRGTLLPVSAGPDQGGCSGGSPGLRAALAQAEAGQREAAGACAALGRSLEQVAAGLLALVRRGELLLAPERRRALEQAARTGLHLSRTLPPTRLVQQHLTGSSEEGWTPKDSRNISVASTDTGGGTHESSAVSPAQAGPEPDPGQALRRCQSAGALPATAMAGHCAARESLELELEPGLWADLDLWAEPRRGTGGSGEASAEDSGSEAAAGIGRRPRGRRMRSDPGPGLAQQSTAVQTLSSQEDGGSVELELPLLQLAEAQTLVEQLQDRVSELEMHLTEKDNEVLERQCALLEARTECEGRCVQAQEQVRQLEAAASQQAQALEAEKARARQQVEEAERLGAEFAAGLRQQVEEAQAVYAKVQARVQDMESAHKSREAELRRAVSAAERRLREAEAALRRQRDAAAEAESAAALERTRLEHDRLQLERTLRRQQQHPHMQRTQRKLAVLEQQVAQLACGPCGSPPLHLCLTDSTEHLLLPDQRTDGGSLSSGLDSYSVDGMSLAGSVWSSHSVRVADYMCDDPVHQVAGGLGSPDLGIGSDHGQCSSLETGCILTGSDSDVDSAEEPAARPDSKVLGGETERLRCENEALKRNLGRTKRLLEATVAQLTSSNQLKRQMERAICRQLHRTQRVLQQARGDRCGP